MSLSSTPLYPEQTMPVHSRSLPSVDMSGGRSPVMMMNRVCPA